MNIIPLDWDTINCGFKVGLYETKELTQWSFHELKVEAKERGFRLVYINCLNKLDDSSSFYDKKIIFTKERSNIQGDKNKNIISYKDKHHIEPEIYNLTIKSGEYSRYNLDKNFPTESFHLLNIGVKKARLKLTPCKPQEFISSQSLAESINGAPTISNGRVVPRPSEIFVASIRQVPI